MERRIEIPQGKSKGNTVCVTPHHRSGPTADGLPRFERKMPLKHAYQGIYRLEQREPFHGKPIQIEKNTHTDWQGYGTMCTQNNAGDWRYEQNKASMGPPHKRSGYGRRDNWKRHSKNYNKQPTTTKCIRYGNSREFYGWARPQITYQ